jgi:two-component system phosphate regulon response regulator PhoB
MPKKTILIADDEGAIVKAVTTFLTMRGYEAIGGCNGLDGFRKAKEHDPDLIILDINMPGMGGVEASRKLKADSRTKDIPIILISGTVAEQDDVKAALAESMAEAFLEKPFELKELLAVIEKMLAPE